jgi:hypothetical protein
MLGDFGIKNEEEKDKTDLRSIPRNPLDRFYPFKPPFLMACIGEISPDFANVSS